MVPPVNIDSFPEFDARATITSPRSLRACSEEGVAPQDLVYKPIDAFAERGLSPRLIKLRYDFFEAKRRDLLSSTRRARERLIEDESRDPRKSNLREIAQFTGLHEGQLLALQGDTLKRERLKMLRAQQLQKGWLKNTLLNELKSLQELEKADQKLIAEGSDRAEKEREYARRTKEMNDKRAEEEERKRIELLAQEKYEKQMAKEEFHRQQEEQERLADKAREEDRLRHERNLVEQEKQLLREKEKEEKRQREHDLQQARLLELQENDEKRTHIMLEKEEQRAMELHNKIVLQEDKIKTSQRNLAVVEERKRMDFEERQLLEEEREKRLAVNRAIAQEEGAKRSFQLMMKRKQIVEDAQRRLEDRRLAITEQRSQIDLRLLQHEEKKQRYLTFKRELDILKEKNKEINVARQRRREDHVRREVEDAVEIKNWKTDALKSERETLWNIRRSAGIAAQVGRESVKESIMKMKIASKPQPTVLAKQVNEILNDRLFQPDAIQNAASVPNFASYSTTPVEQSVVIA